MASVHCPRLHPLSPRLADVVEGGIRDGETATMAMIDETVAVIETDGLLERETGISTAGASLC